MIISDIIKHKILIVDDQYINIQVLYDILKEDYILFFALTGEDALRIAYEEQPDLILLDALMPEMTGYEVCSILKETPEFSDIPIIFISALNEIEDETKGLELGAIDYITKPISASIVKVRVKNHLELKRQRDVLKNLSSLDGLTGVANRRRFDEILEREWLRMRRNQQSLSLILLDVDFFKKYNDHYGHLEGDDCLKMVAQTLQHALCRPTDVLARYGGEEFACVLAETNLTGAEVVAEKMRRDIFNLHLPHQNSDVASYVTISLGVASIVPSTETKPKFLIDMADQCLYESKRRGRNRYTLQSVNHS